MPAPVHGAADAGPADSRRVRDPLAGIRFRFHLLLCPEDRAPILVLGDRHAALNTDADPLRRGLLTEESLEDGHSFRIRMTGARGSGFASAHGCQLSRTRMCGAAGGCAVTSA